MPDNQSPTTDNHFPIPLWLRLGWLIGRVLRFFQWRRKPTWLILKPGSLGDALLFTGALRALRRQFPDDRIVLASNLRASDIFRCEPACNELLVLDDSLGTRNCANRMHRLWFAVRLFKRHCDIVLYPVSWNRELWPDATYSLLDAPRKIHFASQLPDTTTNHGSCKAVSTPPRTHELDKMSFFIRATGVNVETQADIWPDIGLSESERAWAQEEITLSLEHGAWSEESEVRSPSSGFRGPRSEVLDTGSEKQSTKNEAPTNGNLHVLRVAVCAGARYKQKDWGAEKFAELFSYMATTEFLKNFGYDGIEFLFLGDNADGENNERIISQLRAPSCQDQAQRTKNEEPANAITLANLAGRTSIRQSVAVIAECDLCIGNDTFGLHAAISEHVPSVVIMGRQAGDLWSPWDDPCRHRAATLPQFTCEKPGCGATCPYSPYRCIESITVDHVLAEVATVIS